MIGAIAIVGLIGAGIAADWGFIRGVAKGKTIILILSQILMTLCAFLGVSMTADSLVEERRDGTLGLLFLTPLSRLDLLLGRLVSSSLTSVYGVIGLLPIAGLTMLYGGVTFGEFGRLALVLANTLFVSLAVGLFISSVAADSRKAYTSGIALLAMIFLGPYLIVGLSLAMETGYGPGDFRLLIALSPIDSLVNSGCLIPWGYDAELFSTSMIFGHVLAWGLVFGAAQLLKLSFLRSSAVPGKRSWNLLGRLNKSRLSGARRRHKAPSQSPISGEPYAWLMGRGAEEKSRVELFLVALFIIGTIAYVQYPSYIEFPTLLILFAALFLSVWLLIEVVMRMVEERKTGSFELLLTSPLGVKGMLRGIDQGLWFQFGRGIIGLLIVAVICRFSFNYSLSSEFVAGFRSLFGSFVLIFLLGLWALKWGGLWSAIRSRGTIRALVVPLLVVFALPWLLTLLGGASITFYREAFRLEQRGLEWHEIRLLWLLASMPLALAYGLRSRYQFIHRTWLLASYGFDYRSAEADWISESSEGKGQNGKIRKRLPFPRTLRGRFAVGFGVLVGVLFLGGQYRRVYYERQFSQLLGQIEVAQTSLPFGNPGSVVTDYGAVPTFLFEVANNVSSPKTVGNVDVSALDPALSVAPKWDERFSRDGRIEMLERVRAKNEEGLARVIAESSRLVAGGDLQKSSFGSWQQRRRLEDVYDLLGCEVYYQLLKGRPADASKALLSAIRMTHFLVSDRDSPSRSLSFGLVHRLQFWFQMLFSDGGLPDSDLSEIDRLLSQIEQGFSVVVASKRTLGYIKASSEFDFYTASTRPRNPGIVLRVLLHQWGNVTGRNAYAWAELASWAPGFLSAARALEGGDPSSYREVSRPFRKRMARPNSLSIPESVTLGLVGEVDRLTSYVGRIRLMRLGISLERARRNLGAFPSNLDEISIGNDQAELNDPYTGDSFEYLVKDQGYRLQSVPIWLNQRRGNQPSSGVDESRLDLEIPVADAVFGDSLETDD